MYISKTVPYVLNEHYSSKCKRSSYRTFELFMIVSLQHFSLQHLLENMEAYSNVSLASKQGLHMRTHTKRIRGDFTSKHTRIDIQCIPCKAFQIHRLKLFLTLSQLYHNILTMIQSSYNYKYNILSLHMSYWLSQKLQNRYVIFKSQPASYISYY